jgi:hypothetical protein
MYLVIVNNVLEIEFQIHQIVTVIMDILMMGIVPHAYNAQIYASIVKDRLIYVSSAKVIEYCLNAIVHNTITMMECQLIVLNVKIIVLHAQNKAVLPV